MARAPHSFVARQPILGRGRRPLGFELLFRASADAAAAAGDRARMSARVLADLFASFGPATLLGRGRGFVNVDADLLEGDVLEGLPAGLVLEIPPLERVGRELAARCRELRRRGLELCLDRYGRRDPRDALLPEVAWAKIDVRSTAAREARRLVRRLERQSVKPVALCVETHEVFAEALEAGFHAFQGFFFARPTTVGARRLDTERTLLIGLLSRLQQEVDLEQIEREVKQSPSLSLNLLRLVNGLRFARSQRIASVRQALMMIGRRELERWLHLLLFAGGDEGGADDPLFTLAAGRAKAMELLCGQLSGLEPGAGERAFLTGMLSLVDALLDAPLEEVLLDIQVEREIRDALLERRGTLGRLLAVQEHVERGTFDRAQALLDALGLDRSALLAAQAEAYGWVGGLEEAA